MIGSKAVRFGKWFEAETCVRDPPLTGKNRVAIVAQAEKFIEAGIAAIERSILEAFKAGPGGAARQLGWEAKICATRHRLRKLRCFGKPGCAVRSQPTKLTSALGCIVSSKSFKVRLMRTNQGDLFARHAGSDQSFCHGQK